MVGLVVSRTCEQASTTPSKATMGITTSTLMRTSGLTIKLDAYVWKQCSSNPRLCFALSPSASAVPAPSLSLLPGLVCPCADVSSSAPSPALPTDSLRS